MIPNRCYRHLVGHELWRRLGLGGMDLTALEAAWGDWWDRWMDGWMNGWDESHFIIHSSLNSKKCLSPMKANKDRTQQFHTIFNHEKPSFCEMQFRSSPVQPRPSACSVCPLATGGGSRVSPMAWYLTFLEDNAAGNAYLQVRPIGCTAILATLEGSFTCPQHGIASLLVNGLNNMLQQVVPPPKLPRFSMPPTALRPTCEFVMRSNAKACGILQQVPSSQVDSLPGLWKVSDVGKSWCFSQSAITDHYDRSPSCPRSSTCNIHFLICTRQSACTSYILLNLAPFSNI